MNESSNPGADTSARHTTTVSIRGRTVAVRVVQVMGHDLVALGSWPRIATLRDEEWLETTSSLDPARLREEVATSPLRADILAVSGALDHPAIPGLRSEPDNVAVIDTSDFNLWWEALPQEARKNVRRAAKRGVEIRPATLDDAMVAGIKSIYDETPVRQGRPFWHYGKDIGTVRAENATYLERSQFLGAWFGSQLIGFMKWVRVGDVARIMQILCMNAHQDKRPIIALIARAAEECSKNGIRYLVYGKYTYGRKADSSITEFKKRLGFRQLDFPRYYLALNWRGRAATTLGLHLGFKNLLPPFVLARVLAVRSAWLGRRDGRRGSSPAQNGKTDSD